MLIAAVNGSTILTGEHLVDVDDDDTVTDVGTQE